MLRRSFCFINNPKGPETAFGLPNPCMLNLFCYVRTPLPSFKTLNFYGDCDIDFLFNCNGDSNFLSSNDSCISSTVS
jgi:hypothetical protein